MLLQSSVNLTVRLERSSSLGDLLAHGNVDFPGTVAIVPDAAQFLAHQTIGAAINDFLELWRDRIKAVKHTLRH